jgi:hypothetical protein
VDVVRVLLSEKDAKAAAAMKELFGPEWNRIRLAVHGKQVVFLMGSDKDLLLRTVQNCRT